MLAIIINVILSLVSTFLVILGLALSYSFDDWVPIDLIIIVINIIYSIVFYLKKQKETSYIFLVIIGAFVFGFIAHLQKGYWILLDLAVIGTSIYGVIYSINHYKSKRNEIKKMKQIENGKESKE